MKRKDFKYGWLAAIAVAGLASCSDSEGPGPDMDEDEWAHPIMLTTKGEVAATQLGDFYLSLTRDVSDYVDANPRFNDKSFVISPLSASMVLAMAGNAVEGELRDEIVSYLGTEDLEGMNELAATLLQTLPDIDRKTTLNLANSVWANNEYKLNPDFSLLMSSNYLSRLGYFNAGDPDGSAMEINRWCADNTGNKITDFVKPGMINPQVLFMLLNAMNFQSEWRHKDLFNEADTREAMFYGQNGNSYVKMMSSKYKSIVCHVDDNMQYASLPFGNSAFSMEILMPAGGKDISEMSVERDLPLARNESMDFSKVKISMPRFSIGTEVMLDEVLGASALPALSGDVIFSLFISEEKGIMNFRQRTLFEVDEKGAKAVAVSSTSGMLSSNIDPTGPIEITVDRPFMFFITEKSTRACVVSGRITDLPEVSN